MAYVPWSRHGLSRIYCKLMDKPKAHIPLLPVPGAPLADSGSAPPLSGLITDHNCLISFYGQNGELLERSRQAHHLFSAQEKCFSDHFADPGVARHIWAELDSIEQFHGQCLVRSLQGARWHLLQASRIYLSARDWVVQLTEADIDLYFKKEDRLRNTLREYQVIIDHASSGICFIKERKVMRCNRKFAQIYGYEVEELIGQSSQILYNDKASFKSLGDQAYPQLQAGTLYSQTLQMKRKDGSLFWSEVRGKIISTDEPGLGYIWIIDDITCHVLANQALKALLKEQQLILDHAMVGIVFLKNRTVTRCNRRFEEIFGYEEGELQGSSSRNWYLSEEDWLAAGKACYRPLSNGQVFQGEMLLARKDGSPLWCEVRSKAIDPADMSQGSIWITMDISERKAADEALNQANEKLEQRVAERTRELALVVNDLHQEINERRLAEERVKHMAHHDALTGLANRALLEERLVQALDHAIRSAVKLAVLFIDLDRFKHINDALGHHQGDQLLIQVARRLQTAIRSTDTVARLGGDEFVIVLPDIHHSDEVSHIVQKIQLALQQEVQLALQDVFVTPSIGIALFPEDGSDSNELMKNADLAMYHAKAQGRNSAQFFNQRIDDALKERVSLENALFQGLKQGQFELYYQPQVDVRSNRVVGAEALIRWHHPEKGLVSPAAFIPLAEETGLIVDIGRWVLETACQQSVRWLKQGAEAFVISANISALQVQQAGFLGEISDILRGTGAVPHLLELELTESVIMKNAEETIAALESLHRLGLQISVDDFGTGYSSLSYLKRFPLDKLKIDRSFVSDITIDSDDATICRTIISMAHNLNMNVVAEGVETREQLALLQRYGCELYQGYLFSRPVPASQIGAFLLLNA